jgi:phage replication-related protein YjqB (UPF0714/DUF867 family)
MPEDKYSSYKELSQMERENQDYEIQREIRSSNLAIITPHGGGIEPGTSEIVEAIADNKHSYYCFKGIKRTGNKDLHIASERFDEPSGLETAQSAKIVITIHGCIGNDDKIFVGGLNEDFKKKIVSALNSANFKGRTDMPASFAGEDSNNICNIGTDGKGIQLEISESLRRKMFDGLNRSGRKNKKEAFHKFVKVIQKAIEQ